MPLASTRSGPVRLIWKWRADVQDIPRWRATRGGPCRLWFKPGGRRLGYRRGECQKGATQKPRWLVRIGNSLNDRARFASLIHEIAHIYLGHLGDNANKWPDRRPTRIDVREFEAEAVSFIVGRRFGLQTASADYLRGYIKQDTIAYVSFSAIARAAGRIEQHAR
jgi:hypothetical protein